MYPLRARATRHSHHQHPPLHRRLCLQAYPQRHLNLRKFRATRHSHQMIRHHEARMMLWLAPIMLVGSGTIVAKRLPRRIWTSPRLIEYISHSFKQTRMDSSGALTHGLIPSCCSADTIGTLLQTRRNAVRGTGRTERAAMCTNKMKA